MRNVLKATAMMLSLTLLAACASGGGRPLIVDLSSRIDFGAKVIRLSSKDGFRTVPITLLDASNNKFSVSNLELSDEVAILASQLLLSEDRRRLNACECYEAGDGPYRACFQHTWEFESIVDDMTELRNQEDFACYVKATLGHSDFSVFGYPASAYFGTSCVNKEAPKVTGFVELYDREKFRNENPIECKYPNLIQTRPR